MYSEEGEALKIIEDAPTLQINFDKITEMLKTPLMSSSGSEYSHKVKEKNNFDWVVDGIRYINDDLSCPFCFQDLPEYLKKEIIDLIDQKYQDSINFLEVSKLEIESFIRDVEIFIDKKLEIIEKFQQEELKVCLSAVVSKFKLIGANLENKINQPSSTIEIIWPNEIDKAQELIIQLNELISNHNRLIESSSDLRREFSSDVWESFAKNSVEIRYGEHLKKFNVQNRLLIKFNHRYVEMKKN
ncbi:AAA family ATPase [Rothia sp. ZJ1223]|uniref:AAA family ATPase n=1 Tax=Rothia sp. ZJ1223 TaxID=2811098 RepID=UPI00195B5C36|nr:AAA family ATPase [Rothia sp. ZJ1223]